MSNKSKGLFSFILYIYLTLVFFGIISLVFLSIFNSGSPIFGTVLLAVSLFAFAVVISNLLKSRQSSKKRMKYIAKQKETFITVAIVAGIVCFTIVGFQLYQKKNRLISMIRK